MTHDVEDVSCAYYPCIKSFGLFFKSGLLVLFSFGGSSYMLGTSPLLDYDLQLFSPSLWLFIPKTMSFKERKFLIFLKTISSFFFFNGTCFWCHMHKVPNPVFFLYIVLLYVINYPFLGMPGG